MTKATRLYLVIDDGSGEASMFALARDEAHAIEQTKHILACEDGDTSFLRAVTADTATNEQTRATLALLGSLAEEATKSFSLECVNRELNELDALLPALTKLAQSIAAERAAAQAALPVLRCCGAHDALYSLRQWLNNIARSRGESKGET